MLIRNTAIITKGYLVQDAGELFTLNEALDTSIYEERILKGKKLTGDWERLKAHIFQ